MPAPYISICMPVYNRADLVGEAIQSALEQTVQDFEIVVWDDGSNDHTCEVVRSFGDPRIRLSGSPVNQGLVRATNASLRLSRGTFIKFLHDDDKLAPHCLERLTEVMERSTDVGLAFSRRELVDERPPGERRDHEEPHWGLGLLHSLNDGAALFERYMTTDFKVNFIGEPSNVMIRRDRLPQSGLLNTQVLQLTDADLWLRIIHDCTVGFVDDKLTMYRYHSASVTAHVLRHGLHWLDRLWLLEGLATVRELWVRYPELAQRRAAARRRLPRDLAWLARAGRLRPHHIVDAARYSAYAVRESAGNPPVIVERW